MTALDDLVEGLSQAEDRGRLWALLDPWRDKLADEPRLARAWVEALRTSPDRPSLVAEAEIVLDRWPGEVELVLAACDALLRTAERRPMDEPPFEEGAAGVAAAATARCLGRLGREARCDPDVGGRLLATRANALRLLGPKRLGEAVRTIDEALALAPDRGEWHLDRAILQRWRRDFPESLASSLAAWERLGSHRGALWSTAIAATAVGASDVACKAWRALGIPARFEPGSLPLVEGLSPVEVRLPTLGAGQGPSPLLPDEAAGFELVAAQPLSPCHGVIRSPSFRDAVADFGDVVLWDGAPVGVVPRGEQVVPRFALLTVLKKGLERRFRFLALQQAPGQAEALGALLAPADLYVHAERVEIVCPRCAAGDVLARHEHLPAEPHRVVAGKLLVPEGVELESVEALLERAKDASPGVLLSVPGLYEALDRTAEAGKHHKRWGAIERVATRK